MNINVGDTIVMRKQHPCGNSSFIVKRVGIDFKIICTKCEHEVFAPRVKLEKNIKQIISSSAED